MRLFLAGVVATVAVVAATATPAHACSCAMRDPRSLVAQTDAAFVGRLIERRDLGDGRAVFTFRVERRVKGAMGTWSTSSRRRTAPPAGSRRPSEHG